MDRAERATSEKEAEMASLIESADLFEVNVPDFKQLKACRKELKILKVIGLHASVCYFYLHKFLYICTSNKNFGIEQHSHLCTSW